MRDKLDETQPELEARVKCGRRLCTRIFCSPLASAPLIDNQNRHQTLEEADRTGRTVFKYER